MNLSALNLLNNTLDEVSPNPIGERLLQLKSSDIDERIEAFDKLRLLPADQLEAGFHQYRKKSPSPGWEIDCLERLEIEPPDPPINCERCICTVVSPGYETMLEALLDTLNAYGQCPEARIVVFTIGDSFDTLAHRTDITRIRCRAIERLSPAVKGAIYSAARFINSRYFLSLEADMLVVGNLQPFWAALEIAHPGLIMGVRPTGPNDQFSFVGSIVYAGSRASDVEFLTGDADFNCPYWINGGVIAGDKAAFESLNAQLLKLAPKSILWLEGGSTVTFNDESLMNLCLGLQNNAVELGWNYNQMFYTADRKQWIQTAKTPDGFRYFQRGAPSKILHFISTGRKLMWEVKAELDEEGLAPTEV